MKYKYDVIQQAILEGNVEILIDYHGKAYWITVNKTVCFGDSEGFVSKVFTTPQKMLDTVLIDNKTLADMWDEVDVDSYEGGWNKTKNV